MIFTSRSAESYDPLPHLTHDGTRSAEPGDPALAWGYEPRPEFEPTRDPFPYVGLDGFRYSIPEGGTAWIEADEFEESHPTEIGGALTWAPRDRNRNRILIAFRGNRDKCDDDWLSWFLHEYNHDFDAWVWDFDATPAEVVHAARVLTLLTVISGNDKEN